MVFEETPERARSCVRCSSPSRERGETNDTCVPCIEYLTGKTEEDPKGLSVSASVAAAMYAVPPELINGDLRI